MPTRFAQPCPTPSESRIGDFLPGADFSDSFAIQNAGEGASLVEVYAALFANMPQGFRALLALRNALVAPFGVRGVTGGELAAPIDTQRAYKVGERLGRWVIHAMTDDEIITGDDDTHLDFRVSLLRRRDGVTSTYIVTTAVKTHNRFGRQYLRTIMPFHKLGVMAIMTRANANDAL